MSNRQDFERFAVHYWGQEVAVSTILFAPICIVSGESFCMGIDYLQLRSIDSLTDEEIKTMWPNCSKMIAPLVTAIQCLKLNAFRPNEIDYLRSIGIIVPFDKYSVEQILSLGWAVVKK